MSFPRYPEYKDSGVEWLGEVPSHWEVTQLKRYVDPNRQITYGIVQAGPNVSAGIPYIRPADMTEERGVLHPEEVLRTSPEIASSYLRSTITTGDIVCSIGPSFGKIMITPPWLEGANLTQGTARIAIQKPNKSKYFFWVLRASVSYSQWESSVGGATFRALNLGPLAGTTVAVPPIAEQAAIVTFLDCETAKIDALVAEQEKLIALLQEKRQAFISHAVTKGLDPNVTMKDSGVEWLGEVPGHWEVRQLKHLARLTTGMTPPTDEHENYEEIGFPWVRPEDIDESGAITKASKFLSKKGKALARLIPAGASLICCIGTIGKVGIVDENVSTNQQITAATFLGDHRYFYFATCAARAELENSATGNVLKILNTERLGETKYPSPPLTEQKAIAIYLDGETAKLDTLMTEACTAITLLQERRTALISAAVTGQIDVRGLVGGANAPDSIAVSAYPESAGG